MSLGWEEVFDYQWPPQLLAWATDLAVTLTEVAEKIHAVEGLGELVLEDHPAEKHWTSRLHNQTSIIP